MKNKTAKQWLEMARADGADWVDKALNNIEAQPDYYDREDNYSSVKAMISLEFDWEETGEGWEYWDDIHSSL